jgi:hypothetical protein
MFNKDLDDTEFNIDCFLSTAFGRVVLSEYECKDSEE